MVSHSVCRDHVSETIDQSTAPQNFAEDERSDELLLFKGLVCALPIGIMLWAVILAAIYR